MFNMYVLFFLVFLVSILERTSTGQEHVWNDEHPFTSDGTKKNNEKFMLIPSIGFENNEQPGKFTLFLNGWYYEALNSNFIHNMLKDAFQAALYMLDTKEKFSDEEKAERLGPFFVRDVVNHQIELRLSQMISFTVMTDLNGRFNEKINVDSLKGLNVKGDMLRYLALDDDLQEQGDQGFVYLMKNQHGCSIISDIDDTIKISEVPDKRKLTVNTFKKDFQVVPGMSELYRSWQSSHQCLIHYVSAMPSQLYYVTQKFLNKEKFPHGSFHMRHLKLSGSDKIQLIKKIIEFAQHDSSQTHKLTVIEEIFQYAPTSQQFIMVGDSGEFDPEIYGKIARKYPERIQMIFIRLVTGGNNDFNRFQTAFTDISNKKWRTFFNAQELPRNLFDKNNPIIHPATIDNNDDINSIIENNTTNLSTLFYYHILSILILMIIAD